MTVRILRDLRSIYGSELDHRILDFQGTNPHLGSGRPITISSVQATDYHSELQKQTGTSYDADVIILNAPEDATLSPAIAANMAQAVNICAGVRACPADVPALIPPQINGESREAAQQFVAALQKTP